MFCIKRKQLLIQRNKKKIFLLNLVARFRVMIRLETIFVSTL